MELLLSMVMHTMPAAVIQNSADRGPYTPAAVAEAINQTGGDKVVSGIYLWLLRTGQRDNPTMKHLIAIARGTASRTAHRSRRR